MLGGLMGVARDLETDGPYGAFEQAVERVLGNAVRADKDVGIALWCALANIRWLHPVHGEVYYSFRAAGDLLAGICREGDYMDWYCCGRDGNVSAKISDAMKIEGWSWKTWGDK